MKKILTRSIDRNLLIPKAIYFFFFAASASLMPFLALYYQSLNLSGSQFGLLLSIPSMMLLIGSPLWGSIADAFHQHKRLLILSMIIVILGAFSIYVAKSFLLLILIVTVYAFFGSPIMPFVDNSTIDMLGARRGAYGQQRLWGAVGWGIMATVVGMLVQRWGFHWAFFGYMIMMFFGLLVAFRLPVSTRSIGGSYWTGIRKLLLNFVVIRFLFLVFFAGIGSSFLNNYLLLYMNGLHASKSLMGLALTVATVSEIPMWFFSDRFIKKLGARGTLILGLFTFGLRAIFYSVIQIPWMVLPVQLLHGLTFSITYAAGVTYASELAPEGLGATAQGLFTGTMMGLGGATGALIGGYLFDRVGAAVMFQWAGIAILIFALIDLVSKVYERNSASRKIALKEMSQK